MTRILLSIVVTTLLISSFTTLAEARPGDKYTVELSILPAVEYVHGHGLDYWDAYGTHRIIPKKGFGAALFDCPQYRISLWSPSLIVVDFSFQTIHAPEAYGSTSIRLFEVGCSFDLGRGDNPVRPFVGPTLGFMKSYFQGQAGLVGGKAGIRYFFKDWAAARLQIDYRMGTTDPRTRLNVLGLTAGMGFFL